MLFTDFVLSPDGQKILAKGGYVPASLKVASPAQKLRLKFVDPATVLDEEAKCGEVGSEIGSTTPSRAWRRKSAVAPANPANT